MSVRIQPWGDEDRAGGLQPGGPSRLVDGTDVYPELGVEIESCSLDLSEPCLFVAQ